MPDDFDRHDTRTPREELLGSFVVLRPLAPSDVDSVAAIQREPAVAPWWGPPDMDHLRAQAAGTSGEPAFVVVYKDETAGLIQFGEENEPDYRHASIDIFLSERVHGFGLGTDAVSTLARHLFEARGHHRITIDPSAANEAAIRCYEKAGFRRVGVMRRYWRGPDSRWHDGLLMDLLRDDLAWD